MRRWDCTPSSFKVLNKHKLAEKFLTHYTNSTETLHEKCLNTEFFLVRIFLYSDQKNFIFGHAVKNWVYYHHIIRMEKSSLCSASTSTSKGCGCWLYAIEKDMLPRLRYQRKWWKEFVHKEKPEAHRMKEKGNLIIYLLCWACIKNDQVYVK